MTIKKNDYRDYFWITIYCGTGNKIHRFVIKDKDPRVTTISETFDISHINTTGSLEVELYYTSDSYSKRIDSYEIYELELK